MIKYNVSKLKYARIGVLGAITYSYSVFGKICQKASKKSVKSPRFRLQKKQTEHTKFHTAKILMNLDYTLNSDRNSHRIAAKIHKVVRSAQHSHGASKVQKAIFEKRPKTRRSATSI